MWGYVSARNEAGGRRNEEGEREAKVTANSLDINFILSLYFFSFCRQLCRH